MYSDGIKIKRVFVIQQLFIVCSLISKSTFELKFIPGLWRKCCVTEGCMEMWNLYKCYKY